MNYVSPVGPVYQAGTLSGNPLAMSAGRAILRKIADQKDTLYDRLEAYSIALTEGTQDTLDALGLNYHLTRVGAMGGLFFTDQRVIDQETAQTCDTDRYAAYFHAMLDEGIYLPPSQFEAYFFSALHGEDELDQTLTAQRRALERVHS
jgi:glutamate-1-semialdehyde 2,1-aminomutase